MTAAAATLAPGDDGLGPLLARVAAGVPAPLAMFADRLQPGPGGPGARPAATLREPAAFEAALAAFARGLAPGACERPALASYWSQFYLAALLIPGLTALIRLRRALPLGLDEVGFEPDAAGRPARFLLPPGAPRPPAPPDGVAKLVEGHVRPLVELCHAHTGLSLRVLWGNAAAVLDRAAAELAPDGAPALAEAATLLGWRGGLTSGMSPLGYALRAADAGGHRVRRVCCLRYRLPGVVDCGALCPRLAPPPRRPCAARGPHRC